MKSRVKPLVSLTDSSVEYLLAQTQRPSPSGVYSESGVWKACNSIRSTKSAEVACISESEMIDGQRWGRAKERDAKALFLHKAIYNGPRRSVAPAMTKSSMIGFTEV